MIKDARFYQRVANARQCEQEYRYTHSISGLCLHRLGCEHKLKQTQHRRRVQRLEQRIGQRKRQAGPADVEVALAGASVPDGRAADGEDILAQVAIPVGIAATIALGEIQSVRMIRHPRCRGQATAWKTQTKDERQAGKHPHAKVGGGIFKYIVHDSL
jgi:hypothetical protein